MNAIYISVLYVHESEHEGFETNCLVDMPTGTVCKVEEPDDNDPGCYVYVISNDFCDDVEEWINGGSDNPYTNLVEREI